MRLIARVRGLALVCIPKNANTSMKIALLWAQGIEPPEDAKALHSHPSLNMGGETDGMYVAAFLRHPAARLVSCWQNKIMHDAGESTRNLLRHGFRMGMEFSAFARIAVKVAEKDLHLRPQVDFLPDRLDFVGRVETLDADWSRLQRRFDWLLDLECANESVCGDWKPHCDAATLRLIKRRYARDLDRWKRQGKASIGNTRSPTASPTMAWATGAAPMRRTI